MNERTVDVAIVAKLKQGALWRALRSRDWTIKDLSRYLGEPPHYSALVSWVNFKSVPKVLRFTKDQEKKLVLLTGKTSDDLWPMEVRGRKLRTQAEQHIEVPVASLPEHQEPLILPPPQLDAVNEQEIQRAMDEALATITPRQEKVLRMSFGIGSKECTLDEIAGQIGCSRERVRQIHAEALRKLRAPCRAKKYKEFVDGYEPPVPYPSDHHVLTKKQSDKLTSWLRSRWAGKNRPLKELWSLEERLRR